MLYTETKILNLTNIITLNNCMLIFDHLNSSLPAIFNDLFRPFKEQHSHYTRGARRYILSIPKIKTSFCSRSVQVKSIKDWNNVIDKIHFTPKDFMKSSEVIKKKKKHFCDKTTLITILDNLSLLPFCLYLKHNPCQIYQIITFCLFCPLGFLLFLCLSVLHNLGS